MSGYLRAQLRYLDAKTNDELSFATQTGQLFFEVAPANSPVKVYVDEQLAPGGAVNREAFVMISGEQKEWLSRRGRLCCLLVIVSKMILPSHVRQPSRLSNTPYLYYHHPDQRQ
jgi:hypothetical protein